MNSQVLNSLLEIQKLCQQKWDEEKTFEVNASLTNNYPKYFVTTPLPYSDVLMSMNRAYSLVTADTEANYHALKGENVLYALNFHFSGTILNVCFTFINAKSSNLIMFLG